MRSKKHPSDQRRGIEIKKERDQLAKTADPEFLKIYERLLNNKKDRVDRADRKPHLQWLSYRPDGAARKFGSQRREHRFANTAHVSTIGRKAKNGRHCLDETAQPPPNHCIMSFLMESKSSLLRGPRGKSGLRRKRYQLKTGGRKATESVTENTPLSENPRTG